MKVLNFSNNILKISAMVKNIAVTRTTFKYVDAEIAVTLLNLSTSVH